MKKTLRALRKENGLTRIFVAKKLGVSPAAYATYERYACKIGAAELLKFCTLVKANPYNVILKGANGDGTSRIENN